MQINDYSFRKIVVDGQTYNSVVIITPETVFDIWWSREGHYLHKRDLDEIINTKPGCLLVGTDFYWYMEIQDETIQFLKSKNIHLDYAPTDDAIQKLRQLQHQCARIVAALHLTC